MSDPYSKAVEAYKSGKPKKAIKHFKKAVKLAQKIGKNKIKAEILQNLAFAYTRNNQLKEGISAMKESVLIFEKLKNPLKIVEGLAYIGALNFKMKNIKLALKYYNEAERIIKEKRLQRQCQELEADICADLGSIYDSKEKYTQSLENYNRALKLYRKAGKKIGEARTYLDLGIMNFHQDNLDEAKSNIHNALRTLERYNDLHSIADCHLSLGNIHKEQSNWENAIEEFMYSLELYKGLENPKGVAESLMGLGISQAHIKGKEEDAKENLEQSMKIAQKEIKDERIEGVCLAWLAKIKKSLGEKDAKKYKNKAVKVLSKIGDQGTLSEID
ncbi:MAG: tetratricopeptide repeat protein [Candidatus Lokiarchaeota archaeon]|nr:tetratricopeptide repeat protein [Candidatus Lokiarchaeota archaeon]